MRISQFFKIDNVESFKSNLLGWAQQFKHVVWLDSNSEFSTDHNLDLSAYDAVLAVDAASILECNYQNAFEKLKDYHSTTSDFIFGYLGYDLKNDTESLSSLNHDGLDFKDLLFFQPKKLFLLKDNTVEVKYLTKYQNEIASDFSERIRRCLPVGRHDLGQCLCPRRQSLRF